MEPNETTFTEIKFNEDTAGKLNLESKNAEMWRDRERLDDAIKFLEQKTQECRVLEEDNKTLKSLIYDMEKETIEQRITKFIKTQIAEEMSNRC